MDKVTDEYGVRDWSKLDPDVALISHGVEFPTSMFGTFDFDETYQVAQSQRQRQVRRRTEAGPAKKPTTVSQMAETDKGSAKVKFTLDTIREVTFTLALDTS